MEAWQIIALLSCVVLVYMWISRRKAKLPDQAVILAEVDQTLDRYVAEITESNRRVTDQLTQLRSEYRKEQQQWQERLQVLEQQVLELERRLEHTSGNHQEADRKQADLPGVTARYRSLIELQRQGMTTHEIAKESGMNHGEVQFILQLASQEASKMKGQYSDEDPDHG